MARNTETINHPAHYGGGENPYEAIKVIEAWDLNFSLGNSVKYISRAGKKAGVSDVEDLKKAAWYLQREIDRRGKHQDGDHAGVASRNTQKHGRVPRRNTRRV